MVFKLTTGAKRYRINHNMIVKIICVQMGGDDYLVILAPHTPCSFQSDLMCFFRRNLATYKTLITVIGNIPAELAVTTLSSHHIFVCFLLRTVDTRNIHRLIRLFVILNITECRIYIFIQDFFVDGFVRVTSIFYYFFQHVFDRPESGGRHLRISSFRGNESSI